MKAIGKDFGDVARKTYAVASGALGNGKPVVVNSDGTVSVGAETSNSEIIGADEVFESAAVGATGAGVCATFDSSNNKVVIAYRDDGNSGHGTAVVGTVASDDITFGTPVVFEAASVNHMGSQAITFDSNSNKVVINYNDGGDSDKGKTIIGTVSGTSISFGTAVVFNDAATYEIGCTFDSTNNKVVIVYGNGGDSAQGYAIVGTVSSTSISFGTAVEYEGAETKYNTAAFDTVNGKVLIAYNDDGDSGKGKACVATVSGTNISFGSIAEFEAGNSHYIGCAYESTSGKTVISYRDIGNSNYGTAVVATISSTSVSFGTPVVFESAQSDYVSIAPFAAAGQVAISYQDVGDSNQGKLKMGTVSGTAISYGSEIIYATGNTQLTTTTTDTNANQIVIAYRDEANSSYGTANVVQPAYTSTNLTAENYIGITPSAYPDGAGAKIQTKGAVNEVQSSLTPGQSYYVQTDGTLGTTADSPSVFAGTAVTSTKIIVKG